MKKQLLQNMLATIVALFIAIIALPTTAQAQDYVDLGLPSGTKWATCNLGASKPSDYGDYYAWGETEPKTEFTWATYKWMQTGESDWNYITKYTFADGQTEGIWYDSDGTFIGDGKTTLEAADDAATAKLGSPWRMPTLDEIKELLGNCTWTWTTQDGKNGYEVKSKKNGKSIFLPAAGYRYSSELNGAGSRGDYWSSSFSTASSAYARDLYFDSGVHGWSDDGRYYGFPVRPVYADTQADTQAPSAPSITSMTSTTNSITVNWSKSTDNMTPQSELRYRVWCGLAGGNEYAGKDIVTNQTSYTVTGLDPDTEYELYVTAFDNADNGASSAKKTIRTKKAVTAYDLLIAGVQVNSDNCNDLTVIDGVSGTVKYDPATKTLTLEDATINTTDEDKVGIFGEIDGLTVQVKGTSSVTAQSAALVFNKSATLTGDGTLNATGNANCAIYIGNTSLTIDGCTVNAMGNWGIAGSYGPVETLTIKNATVTAEGPEGSICDFKEIVLKNCAITAPSGATIEGGNVMLGGSVCTKQVVIEPTGTGIDTPTADVPARKQGVYNLQGVRLGTSLDRLPKGIYIVDGKKVVKK